MGQRRVGRSGRSVPQVNPTNGPLQLVFDVQREPQIAEISAVRPVLCEDGEMSGDKREVDPSASV